MRLFKALQRKSTGIRNSCGLLPALLFPLAMLLISIVWLSLALYEEREQRFRHQVELGLKSLGELQVKRVVEWRSRRLADAMALTDDSLFAKAVVRWQRTSAPELEAVVNERLRILVERSHYTVALLLSPEGRLLISSDSSQDGALSAQAQKALRQALDSAQPVLAEPHEEQRFSFPFIGVFAPLYEGERAIGVVWLVADMRSSLYPQLEGWPNNSQTGESLLLQRNEDGVIVPINPLRHGDQTLFESMGHKDNPATMAFQGVRGVTYGHDYRGAEVLAVSSAVPGSPWMLVTKIDVAEAFIQKQRREGLAAGLLIGLALLLVVSMAAIWQWNAWRRERTLKRALERNMRWLENAQKAASIGYFAYEEGSQRFHMSGMACIIFGLPKNDVMALREWISMLSPLDREQTLAIHGKAMSRRTPLHAQYRINRQSDGELRWIQVWGEYEDKPISGRTARMTGTVQDISDRKQAEEQLESYRSALEAQVRLDPLTRVSNRLALDEAVASEWNRAMRHGTTLALLMVDVDHFKAYNDFYGHLAGDRCLQQVAQALRGSLRRAGELVARYGGEEFAVLLPDADEQQAMDTAQRLGEAVRALELRHEAPGAQSLVSVSIGMACLSPCYKPGQTAGEEGVLGAQDLFQRADEALYQAKQQGRARVCAYTADASGLATSGA